jgi:hypothetical protein
MILATLILLSLALMGGPAWAGFTTAGGTSNQHWVISDHAVLDNPDSDWTLSFMLKNDAGLTGTDRTIVTNSATPGTNPGFTLYCSNTSGPGNFVARNNDATVDQSSVSSVQECLTTGVWRRVIIQHAGNALTVYLDNVLIANSNAVVGNSDGPAGGLWWGEAPDSTGDSASSYCDVAKWSRLLSSAERAALNFTSAAMFPQSQTLFIPAVREFTETRVPLTVTNSSSTITDCPRLFRPN